MKNDWKENSRSHVYSGYRKIDNIEFTLPDGSNRDFDIKIEPLVSSVFAITKEREVILATQFRPGPQKIFNELPGGVVEGREDPHIAAKRELLEETGYDGKIISLLNYSVCAYSTQRRFCYIALDCEKVSSQDLDDGEYVEVTLMGIEEFKKYLQTGDLTDTTCAFAGLEYLRENNIP